MVERIKHYIKELPSFSEKLLKMLFGSFYIIQVLLILCSLINERFAISEVESRRTEVVYKALTLNEITKYFGAGIYLVLALVVSVIPIVLLFRYYIPTKSIYVMLRLPEKGIRLNFYKNNNIGIMVIEFCGWFIELVVLQLFTLFYSSCIPVKNRDANVWYQFFSSKEVSILFPLTNPIELIRPISLIVLLPTLFFLLGLTIVSKKHGLLAAVTIVFAVIAIYISIMKITIGLFLLPIAVIAVAAVGIYYINCVQIV